MIFHLSPEKIAVAVILQLQVMLLSISDYSGHTDPPIPEHTDPPIPVHVDPPSFIG